MGKYDIGVVIPTLNSARTVEWTLTSLFNQGDCRTDVIVADSGSTDGTLELCAKWKVQTVYVPKGNLYRAVNVGMKQLTNTWITYLNSDDMVFADSYSRLIEHGLNQKADVTYGNCCFIDMAGHFLFSQRAAPSVMLEDLFRGGIMGFAQPATAFRRQIYEEMGGFSESLRQIADYEFFTRAKLSGASFAHLPHDDVAAFRIHAGQVSANRNEVNSETQQVMQANGFRRNIKTYWALNTWRAMNTGMHLLKRLR